MIWFLNAKNLTAAELLHQFDVFLTVHQSIDLSKYQLSAHSLNIQQYKLHYTPQHVSSSTLLIMRRTNCITTASGIVTLCKQPYSMWVESGQSSPLSTCMLYGCLQRVTIPEAVVIQLDLLRMSSVIFLLSLRPGIKLTTGTGG